MFDVSARPYAPARTLTFAVPMRRFEQMVRNMDERLLMIAAPNLRKKREEAFHEETV
jgi:hypothetical protein